MPGLAGRMINHTVVNAAKTIVTAGKDRAHACRTAREARHPLWHHFIDQAGKGHRGRLPRLVVSSLRRHTLHSSVTLNRREGGVTAILERGRTLGVTPTIYHGCSERLLV